MEGGGGRGRSDCGGRGRRAGPLPRAEGSCHLLPCTTQLPFDAQLSGLEEFVNTTVREQTEAANMTQVLHGRHPFCDL